MKWTAEQQDIFNAAGSIRINAVAGSGKTTTIIEYAATRPEGSRILYLAFNKSVRIDATQKFAARGLSKVQVETAHSLAYRHIVTRHAYRVAQKDYTPHQLVEILGLAGNGEKHGEHILASHVQKFIAYFCNSQAQKVQDLNYLDIVSDSKARQFVQNFYTEIEYRTRLLLAKMNSGEIEITHDFYLKKFQLSYPRLPFDYILFDEGQDASPAMLDIFMQQPAVKVIIGDAHQQIYSWRYAINSLDKLDFPRKELSASFRFGPDIANLAMEVLYWKSHVSTYKPVNISGKGNTRSTVSCATIARTNIGLLISALDFINDNRKVKKIYFEGNFNSYAYADDGASLYDILNLHNAQHDRIRDKLIGSMQSMDDLKEYIEKTDDVQLRMMLDFVEEYENEIPSLIRSLKDKHVTDEEKSKAEMIFSTVHRAKGMEYDEVTLADDYISEDKLVRLLNNPENPMPPDRLIEEINLLYVAVTRAKRSLKVSEKILPKDFPITVHIQVIREKQKPAPTPPVRKPAVKDYTSVRLAKKTTVIDWSEQRDDQLKKMFYSSKPIRQIADYFGEKQGVILKRLRTLGCIDED